jgi:hypothetical protein
MSIYPFTVSLNANIQVSATDDGYTLSAAASEENGQPLASMLILPVATGIGDVLAHLREGNATPDALVQTLAQREGTATGEQFALTLQQLDQRGWLNYAVLPLAVGHKQPLQQHSVAPSAAPELPDNKLAARIPGFADLQAQTLGDDRITIVVLDGNADFERSCFQGANVSKVFPYWHEPAEPIADADYATYLEIQHSDLKSEAKAEKMQAALPDEALRQRIAGDCHATGIISVMVGQPGSPVPGIAPRCRVINIPLNTSKDKEEFISALNLARAFELALELGANVIHCAACRPT